MHTEEAPHGHLHSLPSSHDVAQAVHHLEEVVVKDVKEIIHHIEVGHTPYPFIHIHSHPLITLPHLLTCVHATRVHAHPLVHIHYQSQEAFHHNSHASTQTEAPVAELPVEPVVLPSFMEDKMITGTGAEQDGDLYDVTFPTQVHTHTHSPPSPRPVTSLISNYYFLSFIYYFLPLINSVSRL